MNLSPPSIKTCITGLLSASLGVALSLSIINDPKLGAPEQESFVEFKETPRVIKEGYTFEDQLDALIVSNWVSRNKANLLDKISSCKADSTQRNCEAIMKKVRFLKGKYNAASHTELYSMLELHALPTIEDASDHRVVTESPLPVRKSK